MDYRLPIPKNWQDFESICHKLWREIWNDPNAQLNGRNGQPQGGVDIFGTPIYTKAYYGVQCKDKDLKLGSVLTTKELIIECKKAKTFSPSISSFTLATTSKRDVSLQMKARQLSHNKIFPFEVQVWAWDDIQSEIIYRPSILNGYYPGLTMPIDGQTIINLNRFSPKEHLSAYFSRPAVKNLISYQLKQFIISLAYELSDNAYLHGKASNFNISIEDKKITFKDNGKVFNPLKELDSSSATSTHNVGSFVLDIFIKKFKGLIEPKYFRKLEGGIGQNNLEFIISGDLEPFDKKDYIELYVDWHQAAGRDAARKLALLTPITTGIKDIIWTVTDGYAISFFYEFIIAMLSRLDNNQRFIVSVPRNEMYQNLEKWCNDKRLIVQRR